MVVIANCLSWHVAISLCIHPAAESGRRRWERSVRDSFRTRECAVTSHVGALPGLQETSMRHAVRLIAPAALPASAIATAVIAARPAPPDTAPARGRQAAAEDTRYARRTGPADPSRLVGDS